MSPSARIAVALLVATVAALAGSAAAGAFSLTGVTVTPQAPSGPLPASGPTAAGAHPNLVVKMTFNRNGDGALDSAEGFTMRLAPGIVSYVNHVARCSTAAFGPSSGAASSCPSGSAVGSTSTAATVQATPPPATTETALTLGGTIYNIDPPAGSPAALGIDISTGVPGQDIKLVALISVDPHDLGLTATLHGLPNTAAVGPAQRPAHIDSITQTLFGYVAGRSFFTSPTACIRAPVTIDAVSHAHATGSATGSYTPTDCAHEPFSTSLAISAVPPISDFTSEIAADVKPGSADIPRVSSHVKSDTVTLPPGVLINPALAARLDACTDAQFRQRDTAVPARCPRSSAVGDITFVSPILGAFPGKAYFGSQTPSDRLRLFLDVPLYGAHIKVSAHVHPSFTTGQIRTVFDQLPQIAFTDFQLVFHGGPRSALVTPTTCGTHTAIAQVFPWSGGPQSVSTASFTTSWDGKGAPCRRVFHPTMATSVSPARSGASPSFTLTATRPDRNVPIGRTTFALPAGLVGDLALPGLRQCELATAARGHCPASSRIGHVQALAGSGTEPPSLPGSIFLTKPRVPGDPAGLSVVVPAHLGPVDAGVVIVGVRIQLRSDGGLTTTSDPIPALQLGIPLALRRLTVTIDRRGFMRNPTSCGARPAFGHFDALGGGSADAASAIALSGCERLPFAPRFSVALGARHRTGPRSHPPLTTRVEMGSGEAAIRTAHVTLPSGLAANVDALSAACTPAALAAGTCSAHARIASAVAVSPLLGQPLRGPVYLVQTQPGHLPKLVVQLHGPLSISFEGFVKIGARGRIATTFPAVPDLPISTFILRFHGGAFGSLSATRNLCRRRLHLPATFTGHNGKVEHARPRIAVRGCPKPRRHPHRRRHRHRR